MQISAGVAVTLLAMGISFWEKAGAAALSESDVGRIKERSGFSEYYLRGQSVRPVRVGVFDKGFEGYLKEIGKTLPSNTQYHEGPIKLTEPETNHGTVMAQLLVSLLTDSMRSRQFLDEIHLFNVHGFSNFKFAIEKAIAEKLDLILYAEVWDYGGNNDGKGFFNFLVNKAIDSGIVWINAAGNFRNSTFNAPITTIGDDWIKLPCANSTIEVRCQAPRGQLCSLRAVLSWNDFKDDILEGTEYDLDLLLTDDMQNRVAASQLTQSANRDENREGFSKYPREIITIDVPTGLYLFKIKNKSKNFKDVHRLRLSASGNGIEFPKHCKSNGQLNRTENESILNPADNPRAITVGASDLAASSISVRLKKPELLTSSILHVDSEELRGSSIAAAVVSAGAGIVRSMNPLANRKVMVRLLSNREEHFLELGFTYTGPGCFFQFPGGIRWPHLQEAFRRNAILVDTTGGPKLLVEFDPWTLAPYLRRYRIDDIFYAQPNGFGMFPREMINRLPFGTLEIFQGLRSSICRPENGDLNSGLVNHRGEEFRLPPLY